MTKITIYASAQCEACAEVVPLVRRLAKRKRIQVEVVDVDKCHTEKCDSIKYVPYFTVDGREIRGAEELEKLLK